MTIKTRQVVGVTALVGVIVAVLSLVHLATLARLSLQETASRGDLLANAIFQRAREVVPGTADPHAALRQDPGLRSILESAIAYSKNVAYAAIVDPSGVAIAHSFPGLEGRPLPPQDDLHRLQEAGIVEQARAFYSNRIFEVHQRLLFGNRDFGSIRIGVSTLLVRSELQQALTQALQSALAAILLAMLVSTLLSQWMLRPIHVIRAGLSRLGKGESGVRLNLPPGDEFRELGTSFEAVSAQLDAMRGKTSTAHSEIETVVEKLEDAVALVNANGGILFANPAMRALIPGVEEGRSVEDVLDAGHPARQLVDAALLSRRAQGPITATWGSNDDGEAAPERLLVVTPIEDPSRRFTGAMLLARNLGYLDQVRSTLRYSRKQAALGRLLAGVAHEVKNPLNAMTIHLELLRNKLSHSAALGAHASTQAVGAETRTGAADVLGLSDARTGSSEGTVVIDEHPAKRHVDIIAAEIKRLDTVMQDFLKFARPGELKLEPVSVPRLLEEVGRVIGPDAERARVTVKLDCAPGTPDISVDAGMLRQALMNLAINAYQAMPDGGTLFMGCRYVASGRVEITVEDTGTGIRPEHLDRIFDLYFTTKQKGSGIGLSMVYRTVQMHDGDIEVQSTPGHGTRFRILLPTKN